MRLCDITDEMAAAKKAAVVERAEELGCEVYFIDGMDKAIVGTHYTQEGNVVAVYERGLCLECLAQQFSADCAHDEDPYEQAIEWFEYNTLGSLPSLYEKAPLIIEIL